MLDQRQAQARATAALQPSTSASYYHVQRRMPACLSSGEGSVGLRRRLIGAKRPIFEKRSSRCETETEVNERGNEDPVHS
jgi:hypothetical protein